ncbi:DUF1611 domain-containing protein [bacterium AH-315-K03]|nr:DUF1611 domain-containing protein [bacterium AH-315-K03]
MQITLKTPYLLFIGAVDDPIYAKTALGITQWCPNKVAGQLRFTGNSLDLGVPDISLQQAAQMGVKSLLIGVAPIGGTVDSSWISVLTEAATLGMDVVSGLHTHLETFTPVAEAAKISGSLLINVRQSMSALPVGNGLKRSGKRVLMVGTDCAVGKKYTALALTRHLKKHNINATFRATGQTGIMIAGSGIAIDTVVSDFVSGAAELVSPNNDTQHWDVIEGQGSLFNPSYAGVSLGLLHGSQPDAIVVCHDACRKTISSCPHIELPSIADCIELNLCCARQTNPNVVCAGISVNTSNLEPHKRQHYLHSLASETGLPCIDPIIDGCESITEKIQWLNNNESAQIISV